jgi:hypothetical protein
MPRRDYDSDVEEMPRRPRRRKVKRPAGPNPVVILVCVGVGLLLVAGASVGGYFLFREKPAPSAPVDPFPGMLAHWSFDDVRDMKVIDSTGRGNDGTLTGGRLAPGVKGNALWLDGRDDQYCDVSSAKDLNFAPNAEFTIACWYTTKEKWGTILAFRHSDLPTELDLYVRTDHLLTIVGDDLKVEYKPAVMWWDKVNDGNWHHVAVTRRAKIVDLYCDGVFIKSDANSNSGGPLSGNMRAIGANLKFTQEDLRKIPRIGFKGGIDEVYVFSRALTAPEIQLLMKR